MDNHLQSSIDQLKELYANEEYEDGYNLSKNLFQRYPKNLPIRIHHALLGSKVLKKDEADQLWKSLESDFPTSFHVPYKWAEKLLNEDYTLACRKFEEAFFIDKTKKFSLRKAINISHDVRDWNYSKNLCKTYLSIYPNDEWVKLRLAQNELRSNNQSEAWTTILSIVDNLTENFNNGIVQLLLELREYELLKTKVIPHKSFEQYPILKLLIKTRIEKLENPNASINLEDQIIHDVLNISDNMSTAHINALVELAKLDRRLELQLKSIIDSEKYVLEDLHTSIRSLYERITPKNNIKLSSNRNKKVDLVYSWADVNDPNFKGRLEKHLGKDLQDQKNDQKDISRYTNNNEIAFSLKLVERNFKEVNKIFIVTNNQTFALDEFSPWLQDKITFINQEDILDPIYIKREIFNSTIIEAFIWNIPNLSEHFMYLCDDFFIGNKITLSDDIFDQEGRLRTNLLPISTDKWNKVERINQITPTDWVHTLSYVNNARKEYIDLTGEEPNLKNNHQALLFNKSSFKNAFDLFSKGWKDNYFNDTLRTNRTVATVSLFSWLGIRDGSLTMKNYQEIQNESFFFYQGFSNSNLDFLLKRKPKYFCLNSLDDPQSKSNFQKLVELY